MSIQRAEDHERLIVALDVPSGAQARKLVETLGGSASFYKIGLELFLSGEAFEILDYLTDQDKKIFVDLKLFDVPATVERAVSQLRGRNITFVTVHGNDAMLQAAVQGGDDIGILAVTALTSLDQGDLDDLGFQCDVGELVCSRARRAIECGCIGVVASGQETRMLRDRLDKSLIVVTPGIRPVKNDDDQKRTVTASRALRDGANYIVVGRPIRDAENPRGVAEALQCEISTSLLS